LRIFLPELLLVIGVYAPQWILHTLWETFEHNSNEHVQDHHGNEDNEELKHGEREDIAALLGFEPHATELREVLFKTHVLAGHETAAQREQVLFLVADVAKVPHHAVPRLAWTASHQQHHTHREGLEVGVVVLLPDEPGFPEQVDAQRSEDKLAQHDQQSNVRQRGQDEDERVYQ